MTQDECSLKLDNINLAIEKIENGAQEYRIGSRTVRRADLSVLYSERKRLEERLEQYTNNTIMYARIHRR